MLLQSDNQSAGIFLNNLKNYLSQLFILMENDVLFAQRGVITNDNSLFNFKV